MAINVQFKNLSQANNEILKAFNSANSAKALEAYQPLDAKQRKLEKLRALQVLKQSSDSKSLAEISLDTSALSIALTKAEGATLQAMLNLLSAKMIQQNKFTYVDANQQVDLKKKVQKKLDERKKQDEEAQDQNKKQKKQSKKAKKKENAIDKLVDAAVTYFKEIQESFIEKYKQFLSAVSLKNLRKAFDDSLGMIKRYTYEVPIEFFNEMVIDPINDFRDNLKKLIDQSINPGSSKAEASGSFSSREIKNMLQSSLINEKEDHVTKSVANMQKAVLLRKQIKVKKSKKMSSKDIRLALHR